MTEIVFDDGGTLVPILIDAVPKEVHRASAHATEQEVERGVALTDHVRPERRVCTLEVVITDSARAPGGNVPGTLQAVDIGTGSKPQAFVPDSNVITHVRDTWATLIDARDRALLATITTRLETLTSMVLIDAEVTRTAQNGTAITAELSFAEVRTVSTQLVDVPAPVRARDQRTQPAGARGTEATTPRLQSLAASGIDLINRGFP